MQISGAAGSDTFVVCPREVAPVSSKNLRGHSGIIEHTVTSSDLEDGYNGLRIPGVAASILDNDGNFGWVQVVPSSANSFLLYEDTDDIIAFQVFPTTIPVSADPTEKPFGLEVSVVSEVSPNGEGYVKLRQEGDLEFDDPTFEVLRSLTLKFNDQTPQTVYLQYNELAEELQVTDRDIVVTSVVSVTDTGDERFLNTLQTLVPIAAKLLPAKDSALAKTVVVIESDGETRVAEDGLGHGFDDSYNVIIRPCDSTMFGSKVSITPNIEGQIQTTVSELTVATGQCEFTVGVSAVDDDVEEGDHFVTLQHTIVDSAGNDILLFDNSTLYVANVLVRIYDDDLPGVIFEGTGLGDVYVVELDADGKIAIPPNLYKGRYTVRLTRPPESGDVTVALTNEPTASDILTPSTASLGRDTAERIQLILTDDDNEIGQEISLTFDASNWWIPQNVTVEAIDDDKEEGIDWLYFPSQPSFLAYIQGPIFLSGDEAANVPGIRSPELFPGETDPLVFVPPEGAVIPDGYKFIIDEFQVDRLIIQNLDVRGTTPNGDLTDLQFTGMNMAANIIIQGLAIPDGISYRGIEVVEIFLSDGVDQLTFWNTTNATHYVDLSGGNDTLAIHSIDGPLIVQGGDGDDFIRAVKLDEIRGLLCVDGGGGGGVDSLLLDGTASSIDDRLNLTRFIVETPSMDKSSDNALKAYLLNLYGATGGTFELQVDDTQNNGTLQTQSFDLSTLGDSVVGLTASDEYKAAKELEFLIAGLVLGTDRDTCGTRGNSDCSDVVQVWPIGPQAFAIFVAGERRFGNLGINLTSTVDLVGFEPEYFLNVTNNMLLQNQDLAYTLIENLDIRLGDGESLNVAVNVRGTSATTKISTQSGDDRVYLSSEANEEPGSDLDVLLGWLDYMEQDLTIDVGTGQHRLMMSDERSSVSKGVSGAGAALFTSTSLTNLGDGLGDFFFETSSPTVGARADWSFGVDLWLGNGNDVLHVTSVPANPDSTTISTTTSVHAGDGDDTITVTLNTNDHNGVVFVGNGQAGEDTIDASTSSHPVILFGERGTDRLTGGQGNDVICGDFCYVTWRALVEEPVVDVMDPEPNATSNVTKDNFFVTVRHRQMMGATLQLVARAGNGGYGDFTGTFLGVVQMLVSQKLSHRTN